MFGFGTGELLILLVLVILLFGAKRIPMLGQSLGKSIKNFKKGLNSPDDEDVKENDDGPKTQQCSKGLITLKQFKSFYHGQSGN